ncbi:unnamed protein product [Brassica rapa subsp. narinosa]
MLNARWAQLQSNNAQAHSSSFKKDKIKSVANLFFSLKISLVSVSLSPNLFCLSKLYKTELHVVCKVCA